MHVEGVYDPYIQYFTIASFLSSAVYVQVIFRYIISKGIVEIIHTIISILQTIFTTLRKTLKLHKPPFC